MSNIAGAFIRNFIDARVYTLKGLLKELKDGGYPDVELILISNFYMDKKTGGHVADWELSDLLGLLIHRQTIGKQTVMYCQDINNMGTHYGPHFEQHVNRFFTILEGAGK